MKHGFVYGLICEDCDQIVYVGSTVNPISRLSNHCKALNFDGIILAYVGDEHMAREVEKLMIASIKPPWNKAYTKHCPIEDIESAYKTLKGARFISFTAQEFERDHSICFDAFMETKERISA